MSHGNDSCPEYSGLGIIRVNNDQFWGQKVHPVEL